MRKLIIAAALGAVSLVGINATPAHAAPYSCSQYNVTPYTRHGSCSGGSGSFQLVTQCLTWVGLVSRSSTWTPTNQGVNIYCGDIGASYSSFIRVR